MGAIFVCSQAGDRVSQLLQRTRTSVYRYTGITDRYTSVTTNRLQVGLKPSMFWFEKHWLRFHARSLGVLSLMP